MLDIINADLETKVQYLLDRVLVEDVLLRYCSAIDVKDYVTMRSLFTDDVRGQYGTLVVEGADNLIAWIDRATTTKTWQHHLLSVYHIDFVSPTEARALTYHTSHQTDSTVPGEASRIIARYHDIVRKVDGQWKIADKVMEIGWTDSFPAPTPPHP
jgi:hypothetical protein